MDMSDLPDPSDTTKHHRLGGHPVDRLVLVGSRRSAFGGDPCDRSDRFAGAPGHGARHGLGKGGVRAEVMGGIFLPAALDTASLIDQCVIGEIGQCSFGIAPAQCRVKGIDHGGCRPCGCGDRTNFGGALIVVSLGMGNRNVGQQQDCGCCNDEFHFLSPLRTKSGRRQAG